ncbi:hypothetical protein CWM65_07005 [Klebsiella sp. J-Nf11]|nr:hypothetical protein CWM55_04400 [Klebsiella sp. G2-16S-Nf13]PKJ77315.1 hypothetical protein CWM65_07005 [Klebsiella sp. J-Nf11]
MRGEDHDKEGRVYLYVDPPPVRGEDIPVLAPPPPTKETPPRAWGRHLLHDGATNVVGNTPTCVGKTIQQVHQAVVIRKHPHVRGEDMGRIGDVLTGTETPPRAWGRRIVQE